MTSSFRPKRIPENCTHNRILIFLTEPAHILLEACSFNFHMPLFFLVLLTQRVLVALNTALEIKRSLLVSVYTLCSAES